MHFFTQFPPLPIMCKHLLLFNLCMKNQLLDKLYNYNGGGVGEPKSLNILDVTGVVFRLS